MEFKETALVKLNNLKDLFLGNNIFAKVENTNPSGSIKDRTAFNMIIDYQNKGILKEGSLVIEATSGNTGIALAYFSSIFNYKAVIIMPDNVSIQRKQLIEQYGGHVMLVSGGMKECNEKAEELIKTNPNAFIFGQFNCPANPEAHYKMTGPEILKQCKEVDYIFAGIGTGGTISGIGKYFKENKPNTKIIGIEPEESPLITKGYSGQHLIQGIGANFVPKTYLSQYIDEVITVKGKESIEMAKKIRDYENIDIGISSGAALLGAIKYIKENKISNKNIVVVFPDKGDRYSW